jgi:uncharacterized membrane protein
MPPLAILTGDYLFRIRRVGIPNWLLTVHAALTGLMTFVVLLCPQYMRYQRIVPAAHTFLWTAIVGILAGLLIVAVVRIGGVRRLRTVTLIPLVGLLFFLLRVNGHLLDLNYSARPLAREIHHVAPDDAIVAVHDVRRDLAYGLAFYRDENIVHYDRDGVPNEEHILVIPTHDAPDLPELLPGRTYQQLFLYSTQGLSVYKVYPRG